MLETQITMEPAVAREHYLAYRALKADQRSAEDAEIQRSYLELSRGHAIVNAAEAVAAAGADAQGLPRIAFAPAAARWCYLWGSHDSTITFCDQRYRITRSSYRSGRLVVPRPDGFARPDGWKDLRAIVPPVPPAHRPASGLERYWLMWEVPEGGWSSVPPVDPALLKRLNATTFAVLAVWDLTEVERMVLRGRDAS